MVQNLTNEVLLARFDKLVRTERKITHLVLEYIAEIAARQLYLPMAYPSLFEFLTRKMGYSNSAAQRRISAAAILRQVPELGPKLEAGSLNLSQTSLLAQSVRAAEKEGAIVTVAQKAEILEKCENLNYEQSQQLMAAELGVSVKQFDRTKIQADGSVTLTITLSIEQVAHWKRAQEELSHVTTDNGELLGYLARQEVERRLKIKRPTPVKNNASVKSRNLQPSVRKKLMNACGDESGCSLIDPRTGRRCNSRYFRQADHLQPVWAGGGRGPENLQILCAKHNRWKYQQETEITYSLPNRHWAVEDVELPNRQLTVDSVENLLVRRSLD